MEEYWKVESVNLDNIGFVKTKLSDEDYQHLVRECSKKHDYKMVSGLSDDGVPDHFFIKNPKSLNIIKKYTTSLIDLYYERYPSYLKSIKMMDRDCMIKLGDVWINYQKSGEYIPTHEHDGVYSFNIWIKLPYNSKDKRFSGNFVFNYDNILGNKMNYFIKLSQQDQATMTLFPSKLQHQVYPFYDSDQTRISKAGNLGFSTQWTNKN